MSSLYQQFINRLERRNVPHLSQQQMKDNQDLLVMLFLGEHYKISCGLLTAEELEEKKQEFIQYQHKENIYCYDRDLFNRFRGFICNSGIYRFDCVNDTRTDEDISFEKWSIKKSVEFGFPCPNPPRSLDVDKAYQDKMYDDILFRWFWNWSDDIKTLFEFLEGNGEKCRLRQAELDTEERELEKKIRELEEQEAQENEQELLRQLEQEKHKPTPKTSKKKKEKKIKEPTNPHKEFVSIAKDIWKKNPAWTKWEKEHKK
jgi:hypothetical protein